MGSLVGIHGLIQSPSLNGLVAKVLGYDAGSGRYKVEMEKGLGTRRVKRANISTMEELDESVDSEELDDESVDAEGVEETTGNGCHSKFIYSRMSASSLSESLSAAPARL